MTNSQVATMADDVLGSLGRNVKRCTNKPVSAFLAVPRNPRLVRDKDHPSGGVRADTSQQIPKRTMACLAPAPCRPRIAPTWAKGVRRESRGEMIRIASTHGTNTHRTGDLSNKRGYLRRTRKASQDPLLSSLVPTISLKRRRRMVKLHPAIRRQPP